MVNVLKFRTLALFSTNLSVIMTGIHKMLVRKANREDPNQTASLCALFWRKVCTKVSLAPISHAPWQPMFLLGIKFSLAIFNSDQ